MPANPADVTANDLIDASYSLGAPIVYAGDDTPGDAEIPHLIGAVIAAADELQMHKGLVDEATVAAIIGGWLNKAGAEQHPTQALAVASIRAAATAQLLQRFTAEGNLHRAIRSSATATATMLGVATTIALHRKTPGQGADDEATRTMLKSARRDLRDAVQAWETMRKELATLGYTI